MTEQVHAPDQIERRTILLASLTLFVKRILSGSTVSASELARLSAYADPDTEKKPEK